MDFDSINVLKHNRIPIQAGLQLTYACNFKCIHCYQTPLKISNENNLNTNEWMDIIDILRERKTIILHFTGGEIFTRKDFMQLYQYAYDKNFKICISTNASLLTTDIIRQLYENPPYRVALTLYGMSDSSYELFTGKKNMFKKVYENILKLRKYDIKMFIKTIANIYNKNELSDMKKFTDKLECEFFAFFKLNNFVNGSSYPKQFQLSYKDMALYQKKLGQLDKYIKYKKEHSNYNMCSAGVNLINLDPYGNVYLCDCSKIHKWSIFKNGFEFCWDKIAEERHNEIEIDIPCNYCNAKKYCNLCAPKIKYEYGKICKPVNDCLYAKKFKRFVENSYDKV